jgi:ABC-type transport system involved in multi-copper enzyme maturation permease subunit
MLNSIRVIALNTYKESIRDRILLVLVVFSILLFGASLFLGSISLDQDSKIIIDMGFFGIFFFGVIITIFLGSSAVSKEIEQKTAYPVLARPIRRSWYLTGKFFGIAMTLFVLTLFMSLIFIVLVGLRTGWSNIDIALTLALFYTYLEFCVLSSLMLLFSSFSSAVMSAIYGIAFFLIGHSTPTIVSLIQTAPKFIRNVFLGIYYIFPNFEKFNLRNDAVYHIKPYTGEVFFTVGYALLYCFILLFLANLAFKKQEL